MSDTYKIHEALAIGPALVKYCAANHISGVWLPHPDASGHLRPPPHKTEITRSAETRAKLKAARQRVLARQKGTA